MSEPQKLHPISYFNGIINAIKQNIVVFFIFIGADPKVAPI